MSYINKSCILGLETYLWTIHDLLPIYSSDNGSCYLLLFPIFYLLIFSWNFNYICCCCCLLFSSKLIILRDKAGNKQIHTLSVFNSFYCNIIAIITIIIIIIIIVYIIIIVTIMFLLFILLVFKKRPSCRF